MCKDFVCDIKDKCINEPICAYTGCLRLLRNDCSACALKKGCHAQVKQKNDTMMSR